MPSWADITQAAVDEGVLPDKPFTTPSPPGRRATFTKKRASGNGTTKASNGVRTSVQHSLEDATSKNGVPKPSNPATSVQHLREDAISANGTSKPSDTVTTSVLHSPEDVSVPVNSVDESLIQSMEERISELEVDGEMKALRIGDLEDGLRQQRIYTQHLEAELSKCQQRLYLLETDFEKAAFSSAATQSETDIPPRTPETALVEPTPHKADTALVEPTSSPEESTLVERDPTPRTVDTTLVEPKPRAPYGAAPAFFKTDLNGETTVGEHTGCAAYDATPQQTVPSSPSVEQTPQTVLESASNNDTADEHADPTRVPSEANRNESRHHASDQISETKAEAEPNDKDPDAAQHDNRAVAQRSDSKDTTVEQQAEGAAPNRLPGHKQPTVVPASDLPSLPKPKQLVAVPVKPAPRMTLAIQNGGKIETKKPIFEWTTRVLDPQATIDPYKYTDLRELKLAERQELLKGPKIHVKVGPHSVRGFPRNMFMAASPKIREYFIKEPFANFVQYPARALALPVLEIIRDYLVGMGSHPIGYSLRIHFDIIKDLAIRRDCIRLGMEMYVAHFTRKYCDKIRAGFIGLDNIAIIEKNTDANDSLFDCLCNNLALSRLRKTIPEPEKFEEFCRQHPYLAERVRRIESRLSRGRSGSLTGVKKPQT